MSFKDLKRLEHDFSKRLRAQPLQNPIVIGPQGAMLNLNVGISLPIRQALEKAPDQVLTLVLREVEELMRKRGLRP